MRYWMIAAAVFGLDEGMKRKIDRTQELGRAKRLGKSPVLIEKYYNNGAALNLLAKRPALMKRIHIGIMGILSVIYIMLLKKSGHAGMKTGMSMMLGGGFSNLWDRIHRGHVVDYIRFRTPFRRLSAIVFNISDFFVFLGAACLTVFGLQK